MNVTAWLSVESSNYVVLCVDKYDDVLYVDWEDFTGQSLLLSNAHVRAEWAEKLRELADRMEEADD